VIAVEYAKAPTIDRIDEVMYSDPEFPGRKFSVDLSNEAIPLWLAALDRPDSHLQRVAIDTITIAHQRGLDGIEAAIAPLVTLLGQAELAADVRRAAVKALIEFDAKEQDGLLADQSIRYGTSIASVAEPALVRWRSAVMADQWMARLADSGAAQQSLGNAIRGLGAIKEKQALPGLSALVNDRSLASSVRMAAARSMGLIDSQGLVDQATAFINGTEPDTLSDLLAIALLRRHTDETSIGLLKSLMARESTVVQSEILKRMHEIDPALVLDFVDDAITSKDVNVRRVLASALTISKQKNRIAPLASLLNDVNPSLRRDVADALVDLAQNTDLREEVISQVSGMLDQDSWRGCEQAAIVLVILDHKAAGDRLVDLLRHPRGEVMVASAWGLRRFAVKKHLPAMLGRAEEVYGGFKKRQISLDTPGAEDQMVQLFTAFGQMRYQASDELARAYVPRNFSLGEKARAAAVWSLGYLHEGDAPDDLVKMMLARLNDVIAETPEFEDVRRMCAVSFGRMNAEATLPDLRKYATDIPVASCMACHWAIEKMTGEKPPVFPDPKPLDYNDWFLKPFTVETSQN
jgi:HEAT repeat protein